MTSGIQSFLPMYSLIYQTLNFFSTLAHIKQEPKLQG